MLLRAIAIQRERSRSRVYAARQIYRQGCDLWFRGSSIIVAKHNLKYMEISIYGCVTLHDYLR